MQSSPRSDVIKSKFFISGYESRTLILLTLSFFLASCGGRATSKPETLGFSSTRLLDGSDAVNSVGYQNIWVINVDGSAPKPLTQVSFGAPVPQPPALATNPIWSPDGQKVAFLSNQALEGSNTRNNNGTTNLWLMNADGSGAHPITTLTANFAGAGGSAATDVVWSPDGSKLAYDSFRALDGSDAIAALQIANVWVVNADGSGSTPLTRAAALLADSVRPAWSPDRTKIAFVSSRAFDGSDAPNSHATGNIWVMNADGSNSAPLTRIDASFLASSSDPVWSPDGHKIAFDSFRALDGGNGANNAGNVWVMNADGSGATPLTRLTVASANLFPRWSPNVDKLVYVSNRKLDHSDSGPGPTSNIWVINIDGSGDNPLTKLTAADSVDPAWSPDGSRLAFASDGALDGSDAAAAANIWLVSADGSGRTPVTRLTHAGSVTPAWHP